MAVKIQVSKNGPILIKESVELVDGDGNPVPLVPGQTTIALCRCGQSAKKPFCDGAHRKVNFQA